MNRRAAIYVRTSSEHQGEKSSPEEQEADCRRLAEEHGLDVVSVYKDIKKYRAKRRMVDPSGTRSDRPGLVAMLQDARAGKFEVILAWREDRLYRGMRAMLNVLDVVQECKLDVLLARETFDMKMAPIKAWVAQMELDGMKERMTMGVKARLRAGKANTGQDRYGYERQGDVIVIVEEEARWVRQIFAWYNDRVPIMEIRRRLIEGGAPQKGSAVPRKIDWARSSIQSILQSAKEYADGIKVQTRMGEAFEIPVDPIIDQATYRRFLEVRQANKSYPSRHVKRDYLAGGLIHCQCGRKWGARTHQRIKSKKTGHVVATGVYFCQQSHKEAVHPECPRTIGSKKADDYVWDKVMEVLDNPEVLLKGARDYVTQLQEKAQKTDAERERLQSELDALVMERRKVIVFARKGQITEEDMEDQLAQLSGQELYLRRELASVPNVAELAALGDWEARARAYLEEMREGAEWLNAPPESDRERREQFRIKRGIVESLVNRVDITGKDRKLKVEIRLDVLALLNAPAPERQIELGGTYSRRR